MAHLKPSHLIFLHSDDADESKGPAQRLKRFFDRHPQLIARGKTRLEQISHSDFTAIENRLSVLQEQLPSNLNVVLNLTGGNKLMAMAAFRWAAENGIEALYLERGNKLTWFKPIDHTFTTSSQTLDVGITNDLDPLALLRCQLLASDVERNGERLTLTRSAIAMGQEQFLGQIQSGAGAHLVHVEGEADLESKAGDALEFNAAAVILYFGVSEVRRSVRLKVRTPNGVSSRRPHAEIDLLFNWNGRLWLVDCKDRIAEEDLVERLRRSLPSNISKNTKMLLNRIGDELKISPTKVLKEDLVAINDIGGLLGQVVCVRRSPLADEVSAYAQRNRMEVILKKEMFEGFQRLLHPNRSASLVQLTQLLQARSKFTP